MEVQQKSPFKGVLSLIRKCKLEDIETLNEFVKEVGTEYEPIDLGEEFRDADHFLLYEAGGIKGFGYCSLYQNGLNVKEAQLNLFTLPNSRRTGIGTLLYQELLASLLPENPRALVVYMRVDQEDPSPFYEKQGFKKWWGSPELIYSGKGFPNVDLEFIPYEDEFYERYSKVKNDCYYHIQVSNDIKPYTYPPNETERAALLKNKENIHILTNGDDLVASVTIGDETVDNLMVSPSYQGKGIGKQALQFAMNAMIERGNEYIRICYMENNQGAEELHYSLGFMPLQNTHVYRKFI